MVDKDSKEKEAGDNGKEIKNKSAMASDDHMVAKVKLFVCVFREGRRRSNASHGENRVASLNGEQYTDGQKSS